MLDNFKKYNDILCKYGVTANQFHLCLLLHNSNRELFENYMKEVGQIENDDIRAVISLGFVEDFDNFGQELKTYSTYSLMVTPKFEDVFLIDSDIAFNQIRALYPIHIDINGQRVTSMKMDAQNLKVKYKSIIQDNIVFHRYIKDIIEKSINYGMLNYAPMTFESFINSEHWETLKKELDNYEEYNKPKGVTRI